MKMISGSPRYFSGTFYDYVVWYDARGEKHREDGPAVVRSDGSLFWYRHGVAHRLFKKPAVLECNGRSRWLYNGFIADSRLQEIHDIVADYCDPEIEV
jgi:hypothetical protein